MVKKRKMSWDGSSFVATFSDNKAEIPLSVYNTDDPKIADSLFPHLVEACVNRDTIFDSVRNDILGCLEPHAIQNFSIERLVIASVEILAGELEYDTLPSIQIAVDLKRSGLSKDKLYVMVQRLIDSTTWEVEMYGVN